MESLRIFVDLALSPAHLQQLHDGVRGHELVLARTPVSSVLSKGEPDPQFNTVDVAFGQPDPAAIDGASRLKWIHISTSGITRYDNPAFRAAVARKGIVVSNSASVYNEACATHALSFILAQSRQLPVALRTRTANGTEAWNQLRHSCLPLRGQTALIIGYGAIGKRLAAMLQPLGVNVIGCRRTPRRDEPIAIVTIDELRNVLGNADHVINILPQSDETRHFFNAKRFAQMKAGSVFYNIGRGATVDQQALDAALRSRRIGAAWLDVTEPEPLPDTHPLWSAPNCYITPHTAGGHTNETKTLVDHFLNNFDRFVRNQLLIDRVM